MTFERKAAVRYTQDEFRALSCKCLWFCLSENTNKMKIKRDKIIEHCLAKDKKQLVEILKCVDYLLKSKFGLKLLPAHEDGYFIAQNMKSNGVSPFKTKEDALERKQKHILWIVIAAIYLNKGKMEEKEMLEFIQTVGLGDLGSSLTQEINFQSQKSDGGRRGLKRHFSASQRQDEANKDIEKLLKKKFVQQLYLDYIRAPGISKKVAHNSQSGSSYIFTWGPRTKACIDEEKLKKYIDIFKN